MRNKTLYAGALIAGLLLLSACKPTEKNYRTAYEKAAQVSHRKAMADSIGFSGERLELIDGPRVRVVNGDSILMGREMVRPLDKADTGEEGRIGIAVARFTRPTNARHHADDLRKDYPHSFVAKDGGDNYYVMIKRVPDVDSAIEPIRVFQLAHPGYPYIGLGQGPWTMIINE